MKKILWITPLILLGLVLAYSLVFPTYVWRQKTTVIIDTPNGPKSGSSVVELCAKMHPEIIPNTGHFFPTTTGEAVVVDLGDGQYIFALLEGGYESSLRLRAANPSAYDRAFKGEMPDLPWHMTSRKAFFKRWMRMVPTLQNPASVPADLTPRW